jgi:hypothetical protein
VFYMRPDDGTPAQAGSGGEQREGQDRGQEGARGGGNTQQGECPS